MSHLLTYPPHRASVSHVMQGVSKAVHKLFTTKGEAIVEYQCCLLRGAVILFNEKVDFKEEDKWW